jgi:hypothetical protein
MNGDESLHHWNWIDLQECKSELGTWHRFGAVVGMDTDGGTGDIRVKASHPCSPRTP